MSAVFIGCASVPLTSLPKLARLDAKTIELSDIEVAVRIPQDFRIIDDKAVLDLQISNDQTGEKAVERIEIPRRSRALTKFLKKKKKDGLKIYQFSLDDKDVKIGAAFREKVIAMDQSGSDKTSLSVGVSAGFCVVENTDTDQDMRMTFYLRTDPNKDFFTLFKEQVLPFKGETGKRSPMQVCKEKADRSKLTGPL